jgi:hypothetical protein
MKTWTCLTLACAMLAAAGGCNKTIREARGSGSSHVDGSQGVAASATTSSSLPKPVAPRS